MKVKKMQHLHSGKHASMFREKRGKFITVGCFQTAEILFAAATNHMAAMFAHLENLGSENSSTYKSKPKRKGRIINKLQGKLFSFKCSV